MITAKGVLEQLDGHAEDFTFPMLDVTIFNLAQTRLSVFRDDNLWLMIFETVGYTSQSFENTIYAYGNCIPNTGIIVGVDDFIAPVGDQDFWDQEGQFRPTYSSIKCVINGEPIAIQPSAEDYRAVGIEVDQFDATKYIRYLSHVYSDKLWVPNDRILLDLVNCAEELPLFFRTTEWQHPDLSLGELPSKCDFFLQLALALERNEVGLINIDQTNTHWSNWVWTDADA